MLILPQTVKLLPMVTPDKGSIQLKQKETYIMKHLNTMNETQFRDLVGNKIFTVSFLKKDGEKRSLTGRMNVVSKLRGGEDSTAHLEQYVNVFEMKDDVQAKFYRKVNLNTMYAIKCNKESYTIGEK